MGIAVETTDSQFAGIERIDQNTQVGVGIVTDNMGVGFLGGVDEPVEALGKFLPVPLVELPPISRRV